MKNLLTQAGIEPAAFRFVAQDLNHCATAVPTVYVLRLKSTRNVCNFFLLGLIMNAPLAIAAPRHNTFTAHAP